MMVFCFLLSCNGYENGKSTDSTIRLYTDGRFIIKETRDDIGHIVKKQRLNKDTIADGPEFNYYTNGKIRLWRWFTNDTPNCLLFYDSTGAFRRIKGDPFIKVGREAKERIYIKMINPPNVKYIVILNDFYNGKLFDELSYKPTVTDTASWVFIGRYDEYKYNKEHKYVLDFYVVDSNYRALSGANISIEFIGNYYKRISPTTPLPKQILSEGK